MEVVHVDWSVTKTRRLDNGRADYTESKKAKSFHVALASQPDPRAHTTSRSRDHVADSLPTLHRRRLEPVSPQIVNPLCGKD